MTIRRIRVKQAVLAAAVLGLVTLTGCTADADKVQAHGSADCSTVVRYEGSVYREVGFSRAETEPLGEAEVAECHDAGPPAEGPSFPDNPDFVTVAAFKDSNQAQVLALGYGDPSRPLSRIMVNEELSPKKVEGIRAKLQRP